MEYSCVFLVIFAMMLTILGSDFAVGMSTTVRESNPLSYYLALTNCRDKYYGHLLATAPGCIGGNTYEKMVADNISAAWVGLNRLKAKPDDISPWKWDGMDGQNVKIPGPEDWAPGHPEMNSNKKCVALMATQELKNKYIDLNCEDQLMSYCLEN